MNTKKRNRWVGNLLWLLLIMVLFIPSLRSPLQIFFNKAFSKVNWVKINSDGPLADLNELLLINEQGQRLSDGQLQGEVIFLNFWATWCPPCIAEMPSIEQLRQSYNDKVVFLLISDEDWVRINEFKKSKAYNFKVYRALNIPKDLQPKALPKTFIINKKGEIVVEKNGAVDWNSDKIRDLLDQLYLQ